MLEEKDVIKEKLKVKLEKLRIAWLGFRSQK
jgi:hypothetical protein